MSERKSFLVRMDPKLFAALERLAQQEMRSVNGQVEYLIREALKRRGLLDPRPGQGDADRGPDGMEGLADSGGHEGVG